MRLAKGISFFICITLLISCSGNPPMNRDISDLDERVDAYLQAQLVDDQFPGVQYVMFDSDVICYSFSGGLARVAEGRVVDDETLFNVFSTTKVVTAIAIMQLVEAGKLSLDDRIVQYLPELPYTGVTIRQVLSHSAGIPNAVLGNYYIHWLSEHAAYDRDALFASVLRENPELDFTPGEEISYSNLGFAVLGQLIARLSGVTYEQYVEKHIFQPLNLDAQQINFGHQVQSHAARAYFKRYSPSYNVMSMFLEDGEMVAEGGWKAIDDPFYFNFPSHGGILASAGEFAKIFMDLLKPKPRLLFASSIEQLFTQQSKDGDTAIALSWFMGEMDGEPYFFHQGGGLGYIAEVRIYPRLKVGSLLLINRTYTGKLSMLDLLDSEFLFHDVSN